MNKAEVVKLINQHVEGKNESYIKGFKAGLTYDQETPEQEDTENEETEDKSEAKAATEVDIEDRYPLEKDSVEYFIPKRLEYELVIFFENRENTENMTTSEVMEAVWNWGGLDTQTPQYKKVQQTMENSDMFKAKDTRPKQYFLTPNKEKRVNAEVLNQ